MRNARLAAHSDEVEQFKTGKVEKGDMVALGWTDHLKRERVGLAEVLELTDNGKVVTAATCPDCDVQIAW
jgi:hypothetical protein